MAGLHVGYWKSGGSGVSSFEHIGETGTSMIAKIGVSCPGADDSPYRSSETRVAQFSPVGCLNR